MAQLMKQSEMSDVIGMDSPNRDNLTGDQLMSIKYFVNDDDLVSIVESPNVQMKQIKFGEIRKLHNACSHSNQKLLFEKYIDLKDHHQFVTFVYQESYKPQNNQLCVFDIET